MIDEAFAQLEPVVGITAACALTGNSRATVHRRRNPQPHVLGPRPAPASHPAALSAAEREQVLQILRSARFADKAPAQVWATLLDEGIYLCSISTMYRLLRAHGEVRERRRQATHPARVRPELAARGPNEVMSWDITKLKGSVRGVYFDLYVMLDIYSRYVVHWQVAPRETAELAEQFIADAIAANGGIAPKAIHADRGTSMTSKPVAALLADLNITQSHSRPRVSNDNPYSEAQFRTLKYCPVFPGRFASIQDARAFCAEFFSYYNHEHRHSGIGLHTPASVHLDTAAQVRAERAKTLQAAYAANPERFRRKPTPPQLPKTVWINEPPKEKEDPEADQAA
ncbi:IS3 family transposase [Sphaerisporangium sp. NBC_01403]|uniref:IS3 family transposase n=1 Tax=Sphaerisporangium sp. NBC_01403 TaxID=2903599 RepID=UPI003869207B